jgi:hypothetical protein
MPTTIKRYFIMINACTRSCWVPRTKDILRGLTM